MTNEQITAIEAIRADFLKARAQIEALPNSGAVLYFHEGKLAMKITSPTEAHACGLAFATIRPRGSRWPQITNGHGEVAKITPIEDAKRMAIENLDLALAAIPENIAALA